jgi:hypothetical protein
MVEPNVRAKTVLKILAITGIAIGGGDGRPRRG